MQKVKPLSAKEIAKGQDLIAEGWTVFNRNSKAPEAKLLSLAERAIADIEFQQEQIKALEKERDGLKRERDEYRQATAQVADFGSEMEHREIIEFAHKTLEETGPVTWGMEASCRK